MHGNLYVGWGAILCGLSVGAGMGVFFHDESWLGGYASRRRRMLRLGHVALVGTGVRPTSYRSATVRAAFRSCWAGFTSRRWRRRRSGTVTRWSSAKASVRGSRCYATPRVES